MSRPSEFEAFFLRCYEKVGKAATGMRHDPKARHLSREKLCTAIACACIRAAALAIAPLEAEPADFEGLITKEVARFREDIRKGKLQ